MARGPLPSTSEDPWYAELRERWRPDRVRLLLIGESAPDPEASERRFFYAPVLSAHDSLYRAVVKALYGRKAGSAGDAKEPWLRRLRDDGVYLIDLVPFPVDRLNTKAERRRAHRDHAADCAAAAAELDPDGAIVCHKDTFRATAPLLTIAGVPLLHKEALPFPLYGGKAQFIEGARDALTGLPGGWPLGLPPACEHAFVGNSGSPNSVLDHALERGTARSVHIAAIACEHIPVDQALGISLVFMLEGDPSWPRTAARLLERVVAETRCSIDVAANLADAIAGGRATLPELVTTLDELGLARAAGRARAVLAGSRPVLN